MIQIPIILNLHIYTVQLILKLLVSAIRGSIGFTQLWRSQLLQGHMEGATHVFRNTPGSCLGTGQNVLPFFPAAQRWKKEVQQT